MSKRLIDLVIYADGIILEDGETEEDVVEYLKDKYDSLYAFTYEVNYEEIIDD